MSHYAPPPHEGNRNGWVAVVIFWIFWMLLGLGHALADEYDVELFRENSTGGIEATVINITPYAETILDDTAANVARATLGLEIGTNVQAWDADLDTLSTNDGSALTSLNGSNIASGTVADARIASTIARDSEVNGWFADPSSNGSFSASAWRTDLGLVIGTDVLAPDGDGSALTGLLWSQIGSTPTTLSGYGITDALSDADIVPVTNGGTGGITPGAGLANLGGLASADVEDRVTRLEAANPVDAAAIYNHTLSSRQSANRWPIVADDNALVTELGTDVSGWTLTDGTYTQGAEYATLDATNEPSFARMTKTVSFPSSGDYIVYFKIRSDDVSGSYVSLQIGGAGDASMVVSLGYNRATTSADKQRISMAVDNAGGLTGVAGPDGVDYSTTPVEIACYYDSSHAATNLYVKEDDLWVWYGSANTDDPYDNTLNFYTGGNDAAKLYVYHVLVCRPNFVSIGDSIAEGETQYSPDPDESSTNGLNQWQAYINAENYPALINTLVTNGGVGSENSSEIDTRLTTLLTAASPRLVFLQASNNDYGDSLTQATRTTNIQSSVDQITEAGASAILLNALYPGADHVNYPDSGDYYRTWWEDYRHSITGVSAYIDTMQPVVNEAGYLENSLTESDGIHPNQAGYAAIGEYINNYMRTAEIPRDSLRWLSGEKSIDYSSISSDSTATDTITVAGAVPGDVVIVQPSQISSVTLHGHVSSNNTVTVTALNSTGGSIDPGSTDVAVQVIRK